MKWRDIGGNEMLGKITLFGKRIFLLKLLHNDSFLTAELLNGKYIINTRHLTEIMGSEIFDFNE